MYSPKGGGGGLPKGGTPTLIFFTREGTVRENRGNHKNHYRGHVAAP